MMVRSVRRRPRAERMEAVRMLARWGALQWGNVSEPDGVLGVGAVFVVVVVVVVVEEGCEGVLVSMVVGADVLLRKAE